MSTASRIRDGVLGRGIIRAAALPPATGVSADLFSIDGGSVLITSLYGYCSVAMPAAVLTFDLALDPDDGGSDTALASALSVNAAVTGTYWQLNTTAGGVLVASVDVAYNARLATPIVMDAGDIKLNVAGGGAIGTTARVKWGLTYMSLDDTARVVAV